MELDLKPDEARMLRDVLQERVRQLDWEIAATENPRFRRELRDTERALERILGAVSTAVEPAAAAGTTPGPDAWEPRDNVPDVDTDLGNS
jgi:hypothetical protein